MSSVIFIIILLAISIIKNRDCWWRHNYFVAPPNFVVNFVAPPNFVVNLLSNCSCEPFHRWWYYRAHGSIIILICWTVLTNCMSVKTMFPSCIQQMLFYFHQELSDNVFIIESLFDLLYHRSSISFVLRWYHWMNLSGLWKRFISSSLIRQYVRGYSSCRTRIFPHCVQSLRESSSTIQWAAPLFPFHSRCWRFCPTLASGFSTSL